MTCKLLNVIDSNNNNGAFPRSDQFVGIVSANIHTLLLGY